MDTRRSQIGCGFCRGYGPSSESSVLDCRWPQDCRVSKPVNSIPGLPDDRAGRSQANHKRRRPRNRRAGGIHAHVPQRGNGLDGNKQ